MPFLLAETTPTAGIGTPSTRLRQANVDFSLLGIGGGGAVDPWDLGAYRQKLVARYRELASREIALGRHRRAAYIFAQLLGRLERGRQNARRRPPLIARRPSSTNIDSKIYRPPHGATNRASIGRRRWSLYERLCEYETIGDLYRRLDDEEAARHSYLRATEQKLLQDDPLGPRAFCEKS